MNSIAEKPASVNEFETPPVKKVVQWVTVRHPEGAITSYPMFRADEGFAALVMDENLRPQDTVIAVTPCAEPFFVVQINGELDMGATEEEALAWSEVSNVSVEEAKAKVLKAAALRRKNGVGPETDQVA